MWWVAVIQLGMSLGVSVGCIENCSCGTDLKGRRQLVCTRGGMVGTLPVRDIDSDIQVLFLTAPLEKKNQLSLGPYFAGFQQLEEVHIIRSQVPAIGKHSFWGVPSLRVLNLTENNISQVQDNNFRGLVNLQELVLDGNRIESMGSGTFHHLAELRVLSLRWNRLRLLSPRLFLKLGRLQVLDLSHNLLEHVDSEVFKDVQELRRFSCRNCSLRNVNPQLYSLLSNLADLDLGDNQFKYLDREEFRDLRNLRSLKLDGNHFPVVLEGTFASQGRLQYLNLGRSHIAKVTNHALDNMTSLLELDLSQNKLDRLEPVTFQPLGPKLRVLLVSGNNIRIEEFTFVLQLTPKLKVLGLAEVDMRAGLPLGLLAPVGGLKHLNISGNGLTRFPVQLLSPVPGLSYLDISSNSLNFLDERTMVRLESVSQVFLSSNPWACDLCHVLPMLRYAANSSWEASCWLPVHLRGRPLSGLSIKELSRCGSGLDYKEEGFAGLALTHGTHMVGLIAAGSAGALLLVTLAAVLAGLICNRSGRKEREGAVRKVSVSTIGEMAKEEEDS